MEPSTTILTDRERQMRGLVVEGRDDRRIAEELGVSLRTVEGHLHRAYRKLGLRGRDERQGVDEVAR